MTFPDGKFDIFITQDVFEHVFNPDRVFSEISRVLKKDGLHIFTVPIYKNLPHSRQRAELNRIGEIHHLMEPEYHGNPISDQGSLVTYDWNLEIVHEIYRTTGMITTVHLTKDEHMGLEAEFLEVLVSEKVLFKHKQTLHPLPSASSWAECIFRKFQPDLFLATQFLRSGAFDVQFYLAAYPDVAVSGLDPALHFVRHGWKELRNPAPWFNTAMYLADYPDVKNSGMNPLYHYIQFGRMEQRVIRPATAFRPRKS